MHTYSEEEIRQAVFEHHKESGEDKFDENKRMSSFDYCYNYFYNNKNNLVGDNMERSCMELWSFLASWGMLRSRGNMYQRSPASLAGIIDYINEKKHYNLWNIDIPNYSTETVECLIEIYNGLFFKIKAINVTPTLTLVTKIMMGVWGCIPAFDRYFRKWLMKDINPYYNYNKLSKEMLNGISSFYNYKDHAESFGRIHINTINIGGKKTNNTYTQAKLVDMFGYTKGEEKP